MWLVAAALVLEDVAGEALGVDPHEEVLLGFRTDRLRADEPEAQGDVLLVIQLRLEEVHVEEAVLRLHRHGVSTAASTRLVAASVLDQVRDR